METNVETVATNGKRAFVRGWFKVPNGSVAGARIQLMAAMNVSTRTAFMNRMKGEVRHTEEEIAAIERIFSKYGVTDVWGEE